MRRNLLVADDSVTIQKVIRIAFQRSPVDLVESASLIEALASVSKIKPDAIIIDASLPGVRTPEDLGRLRADAGGAPMLILIGSYDGVDEAALSLAGFTKVLKKPFESADIVAAIDQMLGLSATPPPPPPPMRAMPSGPPTSLPPKPLAGPFADQRAAEPPAPPSGAPISLFSFDAEPTDPTLGTLQAEPEISLTPPHRAQHATVIHSGGFPGLPPINETSLNETSFEDTPRPPVMNQMPQMPQTQEGQRGRRVFATQEAPPPPIPNDDFDLSFPVFEAETPVTSPGPSLRPEPKVAAPMPPPPPPPRAAAQVAPSATMPPPPAESSAAKAEFAFGGDGTTSASMSQITMAQLPIWVRQAVEDYCERHFKSLAREVLTSELRRLADEKARHLVDN